MILSRVTFHDDEFSSGLLRFTLRQLPAPSLGASHGRNGAGHAESVVHGHAF